MIRAKYLVLMLLAVYFYASADDKMSYQEQLKSAILCEVGGIHSVRDIAASESRNFSDGYAGFSFGDGMMQKDIVILKEPLEIDGAKTNAVIVDMSSVYFDFSGIVYSRFKGDYKSVVKYLGLSDISERERVLLGKYQKSTGLDIEGKASDTCPMTIILQPLESGEFLLGCGWCNG